MVRIIVTSLFVLGVCVSRVAAGVPDLSNCIVDCATDQPVSVFVDLASDGTLLSNARLQGGAACDATITLTMLSALGDPVFGYPAEDIWLQHLSGNLYVCGGQLNPDHETNFYGQTTFTGPYLVGGWASGFVVFIAGAAVPGPGVTNLNMNSADLTGDGVVNLSDCQLFTTLLNGPYDYRADFNFDGAIDLVDTALFVPSVGMGCR